MADVHAPGAERFQAANLGILVLVRRRREIDMEAVLSGLPLRHGHEDQSRSPTGTGRVSSATYGGTTTTEYQRTLTARVCHDDQAP
jgi:hypothetical protein